MENNLVNAFHLLIQHGKLQKKEIQPRGHFSADGRFYLPNALPIAREPTLETPYSHVAHGRSLDYVAHNADMDIEYVKKFKRKMDKMVGTFCVESEYRFYLFIELNKQLKRNSSKYKSWLKNYTDEELQVLKENILLEPEDHY